MGAVLRELWRTLASAAAALLALTLLVLALAVHFDPLPTWAGQLLCEVVFDGAREWNEATQSCQWAQERGQTPMTH